MGSLFKSEQAEKEYFQRYDECLALFGIEYTSRYVSTALGDTHVLIFGDSSKPPLLLFHGMTMSSTMWYPNVKHLVPERCVYAIDVMGDFGRSRPNAPMQSVETANQWIRELMDGLQLDRADIAGHSMGGYLSMNFALAHPERISSLMLYAPAGTFRRLRFKFFLKIFPALLFHSERLTDKAFLWLSAKRKPLPPVIRTQVVTGYRYAMPQLQVMPKVIHEDQFIGYTVPTLLLIGEKEVIYKAKKAMARARILIPHLESYLVPGANHSFTMEHADTVNEHTLRFLRERAW